MTQIYSEDNARKQNALGSPTIDILSRYLDSKGDGTGTKDMSVAVPNEYFIQPSGKTVHVIDKIIISIEDDAPIDADGFGGIVALTNGCLLKIKRGGSETVNLLDLFDGVPLKSHGELAALDHFTTRDTLTGCIVRGMLDLKKSPIRLDGDLGEFLSFETKDNLSSLTKLYVRVGGRIFRNRKE